MFFFGEQRTASNRKKSSQLANYSCCFVVVSLSCTQGRLFLRFFSRFVMVAYRHDRLKYFPPNREMAIRSANKWGRFVAFNWFKKRDFLFKCHSETGEGSSFTGLIKKFN
jgi:hypothetical protein